MTERPARTGPFAVPTRLFAALVLALVATLAVSACDNGEGVRDEGPSSAYTTVFP